jgi:hypothetical protein
MIPFGRQFYSTIPDEKNPLVSRLILGQDAALGRTGRRSPARIAPAVASAGRILRNLVRIGDSFHSLQTRGLQFGRMVQ